MQHSWKRIKETTSLNIKILKRKDHNIRSDWHFEEREEEKWKIDVKIRRRIKTNWKMFDIKVGGNGTSWEKIKIISW